jgi:hypothetical protein
MKGDANDMLRAKGPDAVRERHARAKKFKSCDDITFDPRFTLKSFDDITVTTAPNYLVKGIVPRAGLMIVWGAPKCGKSFWTFDLVMHVALGWSYRGRRVQQGGVVYLALEGGHGFRARIEAWRRRHLNGHGAPVPFYLLDVPIDLVADRDKLIQAIRVQLGEQMPAAVVIDTLNRALIGDENKSDDMAKFIRAADMIRETFGCVVIIIHHCGVAGSRPRGHTSLSGADDAQIAVERNDAGLIVAKIEHMKDAEAGGTIACRLEAMDLGADEDGDPITSCVIVETEAEEAGPKLSKVNRFAFDLLKKLIAAEGLPPPPDSDLAADVRVYHAGRFRERFKETYPTSSDKEGTKNKAYVRALMDLQEAGLIELWREWVWLRDKRDKREN